VPEFDPRTPSIARVYDYLLGGKDNFAADRELAEKLIAIYPPIAETMTANRKFLSRAVTWLANQGVDQFIDLGAGLPTSPNTHETADAINPDARVVYVDNDPVVLSHLRALLATHDVRVAVLDGDVWQAESIMSDPTVTEHVDLKRPVCVLMCMLLHFLDASAARALVRDYSALLVPGSYLVMTIGRGDGDVADRFFSTYNARGFAALHNHSADDFASFFDGLDIVPPGLGQAQEYRPGWPGMPRSPVRAGQTLVGIARVPLPARAYPGRSVDRVDERQVPPLNVRWQVLERQQSRVPRIASQHPGRPGVVHVGGGALKPLDPHQHRVAEEQRVRPIRLVGFMRQQTTDEFGILGQVDAHWSSLPT
jgi:O-methyltransferase involved in polyketide biosynthesis